MKNINDYLVKTLGADQFEKEVLDAKSSSAGDIIDNANTYPFFSAKRLIIVKNFHLTSKPDLKLYESFFDDPADCNVFGSCGRKKLINDQKASK